MTALRTRTKTALRRALADNTAGNELIDAVEGVTDVNVDNDVDISLGTSDDALIRFSTADASDPALVIALDNTSQQLHITDVGAVATDWTRSAGTHPELAIHSNTTPITDYLAIGNHDGTTVSINNVGGTTISLSIDGTAAVNILSTGITLPAGQDLIFVGTTGQSELHLTDNLADALSIKIISGADLMVFATTNSSEAVTILSAATQKLGFFGATAVVQGTAYTQTYATADKTHAAPTATALTHTAVGGTADGTLVDCTSSYSEAAVEENFKEVATTINLLITDLADLKQLVNSVIDDLQAFGLVA